MSQNDNPFTPLFGKVPPYFAGRRQVIDEMAEAFRSPRNNPNLSSLFVGARGTGKTALLTYLSSEAEREGWIAANVTAVPGMLEDILENVTASAAHLADRGSSKCLKGVSIAGVGNVTWENPPTEKLNWRSKMNILFEQLEASGTGVLMVVDEVDPKLDEMTQLVVTYQHFVREDKKTALLMAGLPHKVSGLLSGKSTSFLRRAARHNLGSIPRYEVEDAFRLTIEDAGRTIERDALRRAADAIDGFPFMFQLVGYRAWNVAGARSVITDSAVEEGVCRAQAELTDRVFDATYAELSKGDRAFLLAMAEDEGASTREDVMARLGKGTGHVSTYKRRLLEAGVIEEPHLGSFTFALPGFGDYLRSKSG